MKLYSPKIREELIPALYLHSKHVGTPMTETVNRYVVQGFASDDLSSQAREALPASYKDGLRSLGLEGIVNAETNGASFVEEAGLTPFLHATEITDWYERALFGTQRAMLGAKLGEYGSFSKQRDPLHQMWLYKTLAMNLNRGMTNALANYVARESMETLNSH